MPIPETLSKRLRSRRVLPFVGAGVSMAVRSLDDKALFPNWEDLLLKGADRLDAEDKSREANLIRLLLDFDEPRYYQSANELHKGLNAVWPRFLKDIFDVDRAVVDDTTLRLARAIWQLGSSHVITTNYDHTLHWACPSSPALWDIRAPAEQASFLAGESDKPTVWHLHGQIDNAADIILTANGYDRLYGKNAEKRYKAAIETLQNVTRTHSLLFIGFSFGDDFFGVELQGAIDVFEGYAGPHYALVHESEAAALRNRISAREVPVEILTFGDFSELPGRVEELARDAASAPRQVSISPPADFHGYLEAVIDATDHLKIGGISKAGSVRGAIRQPIEKLYTPLRSRESQRRDLSLENAGLAHDDLQPIGLAAILPRHKRLLIEGQPGAGKTTFLRLAACMLARDACGQPCETASSFRAAHLGLDEGEPLIPAFIRIADLVPLWEKGSDLRRDDRRWLLDLLTHHCQANDFGIRREVWEELLTNGRAILLLDGLDEVANEDLRERLFNVFRDAARHWPGPIVVTSRPIRTDMMRELGFHVAVIEPFGQREIRLFIDQWVLALHGAASLDGLGGEGERYRSALLEAIIHRPRVRRMATNPVMLTCLCVVHWNEGRLPEGRSRVYEAVIRWLIAARTPLREEQGWDDYLARHGLARLALAMMNQEGGKRPLFDLEEGARAVDAVMRRHAPDADDEERRRQARRWLRFECLGSGIIQEVANSRIRFWHLTFQEYLAAVQLTWRGDGEDPEKDWWPLVSEHLDDAQWRETIELFPGCLLDEGGQGRVDTLLERVLGRPGKAPDLAAEARVAGIAGRLLEPLKVYQYRPQPEIAKAYSEALKRSMAIFTTEGAAQVPVKDRIAVAEALGRGGDPRLRGDNLLEVPGTGGWRLGKYLVTVEEYQKFVEHQGYENADYWDEEGWKLRQDKGWDAPGDWESQLQTPNRPVVSVSWFEADAYCRWLSTQRDCPLCLPPEEVWEGAAKPEAGEFPWGEPQPDENLANFAPEWEPNVGSPTPVGVYPAGDGRFGHCDLAGNVWEWSADTMEDSGDDEVVKVLRGGSWSNHSEFLRAAIRSWGWAGYRLDGIGFRVCAAPLIP